MTFSSRIFAERRSIYLDLLPIVLALAIHLLIIPSYSAMLFPYFQATFEQYVKIVLAFEVTLLPATIGMWLAVRHLFAPTIAWLREGSGARPQPHLWGVTVSGLPKLAIFVACLNGVLCVPAAVYTSDLVGLSTFGFLLYVAFLAIMVSAVIVFGYLFAEQWFRPLIAELAEWLPEEEVRQEALLSLGTKLLLLVPAINLFTGMTVAAVSTNTLDIEGRLAVTVAVTAAITLTLSLGLSMMLRRSLLQRLGDLRTTIQEVDAGDLNASVPFLAGDEIDEVGRSLNHMVAGLREREALREENSGLVDDLRASRARLVAAADESRRAVERDLHDGAQQNLVLMNLKLGLLRKELDKHKAAVMVESLQSDLSTSLAELRDLAHGIYPQALTSDGLTAALEGASASSTIPVNVQAEGVGRFSPDLEAAVYFSCLEALQNAAKYAGEGASATVRLAQTKGGLQFEVTDDGAGFDLAAANGSAGLQNMADRIGALGGDLRLESAIGHGTKVSGSVPLS